MTNVEALTFVAAVGDGKETACLMSARALLDGRGLTDTHPSSVIRRLGIGINDRGWWTDDAERTAVLLPVAMDERMCSTRVQVTPALERRRAYRCADMACRVWAPAWLALAGLTDQAERLRALPPVVGEATSRAARAVADEARGVAWKKRAVAAAAAADAAAAAAADADATTAYADAYATTAYAAAVAAADAAADAYATTAYAAADAAYVAAVAAADAADAAADRKARHDLRTKQRGEAIALLLELCEMREEMAG